MNLFREYLDISAQESDPWKKRNKQGEPYDCTSLSPLERISRMQHKKVKPNRAPKYA